MATITKKELIDKISESTGEKRVVVKDVVQSFLDSITIEQRKPRTAQNPKTLEPVHVPAKRTVKFKAGRLMKETLVAASEEELQEMAGDPNWQQITELSPEGEV